MYRKGSFARIQSVRRHDQPIPRRQTCTGGWQPGTSGPVQRDRSNRPGEEHFRYNGRNRHGDVISGSIKKRSRSGSSAEKFQHTDYSFDHQCIRPVAFSELRPVLSFSDPERKAFSLRSGGFCDRCCRFCRPILSGPDRNFRIDRYRPGGDCGP